MYADLARAVAEFAPVEREAGYAAAHWLHNRSLKDHPATATWVYYDNRRVEGFFSIRSGNFRILERKREALTGGLLKPASDLTWICKHRDATIVGSKLIARASSIAARVAVHQGNIALVIEPYDRATARLLCEKHSFLQAARSGQLWLPVVYEEPSEPPVRDE